MSAKLYVIMGSHACRGASLMLEHKRVPYRVVALPSGMHPFLLRAAGFAGSPEPFREVDGRNPVGVGILDRLGTVPALLMDGEKVQTTMEIARHLERVRPDPPLFPVDPDRRRAVEEAEAWADDRLQMIARRLALAGAVRGDYSGDDGPLGPLLAPTRLQRRAAVAVASHTFAASPAAEAALRAELPESLDRVDAWIDDGTLNGEQLNAADYVIAPSLALLSYRPDIAPELAARPAGRLVDRVLAA